MTNFYHQLYKCDTLMSYLSNGHQVIRELMRCFVSLLKMFSGDSGIRLSDQSRKQSRLNDQLVMLRMPNIHKAADERD